MTSILFIPDKRRFNPYQSRLADALRLEGFRVIFDDHPRLLGAFLRLQIKHAGVKIIHLHWLNGLIDQPVYATSRIKFIIWYLLMAIDLMAFRLRGGKLFWTVHNLIGHESPHRDRETKIRQLMARFCNGLCFHSQSAVSVAENEYLIELHSKAIITAHACYKEDYPIDRQRAHSLAAETGISDHNFTFLFFGNIRHYKGLEKLVDAFQHLQGSQYRLLIAGMPIPGVSVDWLHTAAVNDCRIIPRIEFVADADVASFFQIADVLVAPYNSTLSSGVVSLGLTFSIPMILPSSAKIYDLPGDEGAEFFLEGHLAEALSTIQFRELSKMREHNERLGEELTWERMAERISAAYRASFHDCRP